MVESENYEESGSQARIMAWLGIAVDASGLVLRMSKLDNGTSMSMSMSMKQACTGGPVRSRHF